MRLHGIPEKNPQKRKKGMSRRQGEFSGSAPPAAKKRGGSSFRQNALHADRRARAAGAPRRIPLALSPLIMYSLSLTWQV